MKLFLSSMLLLIVFNSKGQTSDARIVNVEDGLFYMFYDSSGAKSTIVEFEKFIALIEVPVKDEGGGARVLHEHAIAGQSIIQQLKLLFPKKPLKYVLHSHWHPHSISSVKPFLENGSTLVTTEENFKRLREFVDEATESRYKKQIQFVKGDSTVIGDKKNKIVAYRFLQKDFPNTPTADYLFFYLPKYSALHCGCMYSRWEGPPLYGKPGITGREEDLNKFLNVFAVKPEYFIRLSRDEKEPRNMISSDVLANTITNGVSLSTIARKYLALSDTKLREKRDSLINDIAVNYVPVNLMNSCAYAELRKKNLERALVFAEFQALLNPGDANAWDTLGEVYYFMGKRELAKKYEQYVQKIDPTFGASEAVWAKDLKEYQTQWEK